MYRLLISLLAALLLVSQWGWVEHGYHEHESSEVCEICVSASGHATATSSSSQIPAAHSGEIYTPVVEPLLASATPRYYASRAPPLFL